MERSANGSDCTTWTRKPAELPLVARLYAHDQPNRPKMQGLRTPRGLQLPANQLAQSALGRLSENVIKRTNRGSI